MFIDQPDNVVYKVDTFRCTFSTRKGFEEKLQEVLDRRASEGWKLHSFETIMGDICTIVFYREKY